MSTTVGEAISRVRNTLKAVKEDPFLTDRTIYFSIIKYGQSLMKREDNQLRLMKISNIFKVMPYVELIEVDKVDAACVGVYSGCYFKRTKERLPDLLTGIQGPIFRTVSSIDGTIELFRTDPGTWVSMTKTTTFKYNNRQYFWYLDGYLYFPNLIWDAVKIEAIFENDVETCDSDKCLIKQDQSLNIPDYLFSEIEQYVIQELTQSMQVPANGADDSQNVLR
jgi:hypothetical protein|tara:strand:+ start:1279 stop:1944 length:666 start_codon:yes stop_codon:yes gene_type:complete